MPQRCATVGPRVLLACVLVAEAGFTLLSADYHAPLHGTYLLRKPKPGEQS